MFRKSDQYTFIGRVVHGRLYRAVEELPEGDVYATSTTYHSRLLIVLALLVLWLGALGGWIAASAWTRHKLGQPHQVSKMLAAVPPLERRLIILDAMTEQGVMDDWRQALCSRQSKRLDAVDPVTGKHVAGIIEEN